MREDIVEKFSQMYGSKFCISMYYRDTNHKGFKEHFIDFLSSLARITLPVVNSGVVCFSKPQKRHRTQ